MSNPNRYCINVDIPHAGFHTGEFIRNHSIYKKFTQSNGWGYLELLGEGSLEDNAVFVKASSQPLTICFYTDDGLRGGWRAYRLFEWFFSDTTTRSHPPEQ